MTARCVECSKRIGFRNRRGSKLSNQRCDCGGTLEMVGGNYYMSGKNPFEPDKTYTSQYLIGEYYHVSKSKKGVYYYSHPSGYYKQIENFILAVEAVTPR